MRQTVEPYSTVSVSQDIRVSLRIDKSIDPNTVYKGDASRLQQVISNFLSNSLKFTPKGGRIVAFAKLLNESEDQTEVEIGVEDTGCGIPESEFSNIFQPYAQVANESGAVGTGLGLNISKQMIKLHGGEIGFRSEFGKGSTFYFQVPFESRRMQVGVETDLAGQFNKMGNIVSGQSRESRLSPRAYNPHSKELWVPHPDPLNSTVLVVEDSSPSRKLLVRLVTKLGYKCIGVVNGLEAVNFFKKCPPNQDLVSVILLDKQMPIMNGDEATRELRALGYSGAIVAITGNAMEADRVAFFEAGANYFITKPATVAVIKLVLSEIFQTN